MGTEPLTPFVSWVMEGGLPISQPHKAEFQRSSATITFGVSHNHTQAAYKNMNKTADFTATDLERRYTYTVI